MADFDAETARLTAATFAHLGLAATYTPAGGGAAVACRVIVRSVDVLAGIDVARAVTPDATIEAAVAAIPDAPLRGARFTVGAETFRAVDVARRREDDRQVWTVDVVLDA